MGAIDMPAFVDWRIAVCPVHGVRFNAEDAECPECVEDRWKERAARTPPHRWAGLMRFTCPFCGSKSIRKESCSKYVCGRQSGLYPRANLNRCRNCGCRTKYPTYCTHYECRKVAGTRYMYTAAHRK